MTGPLRLRSDGSQECAVHSLRTIPLRRARAGWSHAHVADNNRGCLEIDDLPTISLADLPSCAAQKGGGSMLIIQRVTVAVWSVCETSKGVPVIASSPMLPTWT